MIPNTSQQTKLSLNAPQARPIIMESILGMDTMTLQQNETDSWHSAANDSHQIPKKIGRYEIIEEIGYGGMATVYKAHDPHISRTLAIKVLRQERGMDDEYRSRFLREAKAVGILSHPNIVTIYDVGVVGNAPYIAMELLEGNTMEQIMKSKQKPSLPNILNWGIQLSDALEYAHQRRIVHRDIKPSNIILLKDDKTIKITDFGIAHLDETDVTQHTELGEVLGTPQYMSPEQVLGKPADARSDLFSTGVVLYQLLTGQKPFHADTLATLLFQIATENPDPINQIAPQLPGALKQAVDKLLKKKPERRFQSGKELKHALQRVLKDLNETYQSDHTSKSLSIKFKWSVIMGVVVAATLSLCGSYIYNSQQRTMLDQMYSYGSSMSTFIASESAETVLSEDWPSIELFVQDSVEKQEFKFLKIVDHKNIIRGSNKPKEINRPYQQVSKVVKSDLHNGVSVQHIKMNSENVLNFVAPIVFQDTQIGKIHLGLSRQPLLALSEKILWGLGFVIFCTILAVFIAAYYLARQVVLPINTLNKALSEITTKNYAYRIGIDRKDEFGQIFKIFDEMANSLQKRDEKNASNKEP